MLLALSAASGQVASPWVDTKPLAVDTGLVGLKLTLRRLHTTARLIHTVAHPDDEDGGMLTLESRGRGVSALQLTLNRGEGGQNKVGSNLLDELGILRTLELLGADRYYGVEQRFTRVADFGFSKTPEETFEKWGGHDVALADMVRIIRTFRPDVICTRFQGAARDGHGNHQASGIMTREAFRAAADPTKFPEQIREGLQPWQAQKLYMDNVRANEDWNVELDTSQDDPLLGESYVKFAWKGLQHQLSQGAGGWTLTEGRRTSYYKMIDSALPGTPVSTTHEKDFFDGIDTSLPALASRLGADAAKVPWLRSQLEQVAKLVEEASVAAEKNPQDSGKPLLAGLGITRDLIAKVEASQLGAVEKSDLLVELRTKEQQFEQAANLAYSLDMGIGPGTPDGRPMAEEFETSNGKVLAAVITAGKTFLLLAKLHNGSTVPMDIKQFALDVPMGWHYELFMDKVPSRIAPGEGCALTFRVTPPPNAQPTKAYFHRGDPETDAIYQIDQPEYVTLPLPPPPVTARVVYAIGGQEGVIRAVARTPVHSTKGDVWSMPLAVTPAFSVQATPTTQIIRASADPSADLSVVVRGNVDHSSAVVKPQVPKEWKAEPASQDVDFAKSGEHDLQFRISPDGAAEGRYVVRATATSEGREFSEGYTLVTRPDIGGFFYYQPAAQRTAIVDVKVPSGLKIGYIMGAGDDIPTVLRQLGLDVTLLTPDEVEHGDLQRFGTIVLGIRAYDTRDDVKKNNQRLLDYAHNGGTLMVQYNTEPANFNPGNYTPHPAQLSRARVSVEESPITVLDPKCPAFHYPNVITASDFNGWVQERGLYFMDKWDDQYTPLLASNDPGEDPQKGGLLVARVGKGYYLYNGYAFFRQLPFGVPGAIRLYVNLLSVGHEPK
ncbi:MAG TPA: PIG-L family deacetylase [Candidatus Angelobacter sp.]|nr:PIG-L family deacetylase [Candidatus Angelobacter sp.]